MRRVVIISDLHCGHRAGLTPPDWQYNDNPKDHDLAKFASEQRALWRFYTGAIKALLPVDVLIVNGDAIDGKGAKSGGTEQLVLDRGDQVDMAVNCIERWGAKQIVMVYGTPYHVGAEDDWESVLAREVGAAKVGSHEWVEVEGITFDCKHKIGRSGTPYGKYTALAKAVTWNELQAARDIEPLADVIVRSHVHYHVQLGDARALAMTTPALQGFGSKYGARQVDGDYDIGLVWFDCEKRSYKWNRLLLDLGVMSPEVLSL